MDHQNFLLEADYKTVSGKISELQTRYSFLKTDIIGRSACGRNITALKIGEAPEYVLFAGAFHGAEWLTAPLLLSFAEELLSAIKEDKQVAGLEARRAMIGRGIIIVPCVNPDGCEISIHGLGGCGSFASNVFRISDGNYKTYSANARGVDINHNFNAGWKELHALEQKAGIYGPAPKQYGGPKPESEPETAAVVKLCRSTKIRHAAAFHAQGEVIYWDYGEYTPKASAKMAEILSKSSGYALDQPAGLAVGGGFKDWFMKEFSRPAFTVEIGRGENPLPSEHLPAIYNRIREMMMFLLMM